MRRDNGMLRLDVTLEVVFAFTFELESTEVTFNEIVAPVGVVRARAPVPRRLLVLFLAPTELSDKLGFRFEVWIVRVPGDDIEGRRLVYEGAGGGKG